MLGALVAGLAGCRPGSVRETNIPLTSDTQGTVALTDPRAATGPDSVAGAIEQRRSVRAFTETAVSDEDIARMLWSAQGVTDQRTGFRAAPSAGGLYPLELYAASSAGVHRYVPDRHELTELANEDVRDELAAAALGQGFIASAPVVFIISGVYARTAAKYGKRATRYVHIEAGHAAQNLLLTAVSLGLGAVPVGAFSDRAIRRIVGAGDEETPLYLIPVGTPAT